MCGPKAAIIFRLMQAVWRSGGKLAQFKLRNWLCVGQWRSGRGPENQRTQNGHMPCQRPYNSFAQTVPTACAADGPQRAFADHRDLGPRSLCGRIGAPRGGRNASPVPAVTPRNKSRKCRSDMRRNSVGQVSGIFETLDFWAWKFAENQTDTTGNRL